MRLKKTTPVKFIRGMMLLGVALSIVISPVYSPVAADPLPEDEIKALNDYPHWVADSCSVAGVTDLSLAAGNGAPAGAEFPNLDPTSMARSIDKFIQKENPNSRMKNLGATIVESAKHSNVSPFLIVAIAREESSMSDPGDYNVSGGNNSFGRMATSSQPGFPGAGPNAGTRWYKWTSVKASVDYKAPENKNVSGGGDMASYLRAQYGSSIGKGDLTSLFLEYAPPADNDTAGYISNVKGWVEDMVKGSGGSVGAAAGGSVSGCCSGASAGSDVTITGNNAKDAFNYFVTGDPRLPPIAAAGLVGNFMQESGTGLDTHADNGSHRGIAQWDIPGRWANLVSHEHGKDPYDLATQLDFVWYELQGGYKSAVLNPLKSASNVDEAAQIVFDHYEIAGDDTLPDRQNYAKNVLQKFGGGAAAGGGVSDGGCGVTSAPSGYRNPLRDIHNLTPMRIDMGVDYGGSGAVYAIGNGTITNLTNSGWPGGTFISYKLADGPAQGKYVYVAENCTVKVHIGQKVNSDTVLCNLIDAYPHMEIGWAQPPGLGDTVAIHNGGYTEGYATAAGENFNQLLVSLGAPSGTQQPKMGRLPASWPTW